MFGDVRVDVRRFQVARAGRPLTLEPKAFDLLTLLLESHGEVVTKAEIFERLWPSTAVTDNALTRIVAQLRKALGDDAREAKYIETVPTRGYRWLADVRSEGDPAGTGEGRERDEVLRPLSSLPSLFRPRPGAPPSWRRYSS